MNEDPTHADKVAQHVADHLQGRAGFANEIAAIVEQRIWSQMAKWLLINLGGLIGAMAIGIGAYYSLDSRVGQIRNADELISEQLKALQQDHHAIRQNLSGELRDINQRLDEINRFLRDHSVNTNGRTGK